MKEELALLIQRIVVLPENYQDHAIKRLSQNLEDIETYVAAYEECEKAEEIERLRLM